MNKFSIAVVGNPNCGKTTLFNGLTGSHQKTGNWPGVTVEKKMGTLLGMDNVDVVDLPGIYSLNTGSEDEHIARDHILSDETNLVINIVDASNLERNLFLTMSLMEMKKPMILVLNMMDLAQKKGFRINTEALSEKLGLKVLGINALNGAHVRDVRRLIKEELNNPKVIHSPVRYPDEIEKTMERWLEPLKENPRQTSLLLLEENEKVIESVTKANLLSADEISSQLKMLEEKLGDSPDVIISEARFAFIDILIKDVCKNRPFLVSATEKIDKVVLGKWLGLPIFLCVIYLVFWVVINVGNIFIDFFDIIFGAIFVDGFGLFLETMGTPEWINALLAGGIGAGIQTVSTFIPPIFLMFFMLSILEDSGYMARAAFVMDRVMHSIGLPGKAFVPMLIGFGCTVPAVMATRTLENQRDRYLTVFMSPFMSCSARLPVYILFGTVFFSDRSGIMLFSIYFFGILLAVFTGLILKKTLFKGKPSHFVMEIPSYHFPNFLQITKLAWMRLKTYLFRAGKVITVAVLILAFLNSWGTDGSFGNQDSQDSVLSAASQAISPIFAPMGIEASNWPATVGLFTGLFAKEAIIGTINGLYGHMNTGVELSKQNDSGFSLLGYLKEAIEAVSDGFKDLRRTLVDPLGLSIAGNDESSIVEEIGVNQALFSQLRMSFNNEWERAYAYLLFVLIYFPCVAAMGTIVREIGLKMGILAMVYLTILAWSTATLFFQIFSAHNILWIIVAVALVLVFVPVFNLMSGRWKVAK